MEYREEDRTFDVELETTVPQKSLDDLLAAGLFPEPVEDEGRADAAIADDREPPLGMGGKQEDGVCQSRAGAQQGVELSGLLEWVEPWY